MAKRIERDSNSTVGVVDPLAEIEPRTELFAKLLECRRELIASGVPLLSDEEIELEKAERRGGYYVGERDE